MKNRRVRYGAFSAVTTAVVLAVLVLVNVVAGQFNVKFDLTADKQYEITEETVEVLDALAEDVVIYTLFKTGTDTDEMVTQIAEVARQYQAASKRVRVENKDPYVYRAFVEQYGAELPVNSLVVVSDRRFRTIGADTLYVAVTNNNTGEDEWQIDIEPKLTNALLYVTQESTYVAYVAAGHQEAGIGETFEGYLEDANYTVKELPLLTAAAVPEDCSLLILTPPRADYGPKEAEVVSEYLRGGGSMFICADYSATSLTRYNGLIEAYGLRFQNVCVVEGNSNYAMPQSAALILPTPLTHAITEDMRANKTPMMLNEANSVAELPDKRPSAKVEPLLRTSGQAFGKASAAAVSQNKEAGDVDGPFDLAVAVTDEYGVGAVVRTARVVAFGGSSLFDTGIDAWVGGANSRFFVNAANWLVGRADDYLTYVQPKYLADQTPLAITGWAGLWLKLFAMAALPAAVFGTGAAVWLRRRNK